MKRDKRTENNERYNQSVSSPNLRQSRGKRPLLKRTILSLPPADGEFSLSPSAVTVLNIH